MCIWVCAHTLVGVNLGMPVAVKGGLCCSGRASLLFFYFVFQAYWPTSSWAFSSLSLWSPIRLQESSILELSLAFFYEFSGSKYNITCWHSKYFYSLTHLLTRCVLNLYGKETIDLADECHLCLSSLILMDYSETQPFIQTIRVPITLSQCTCLPRKFSISFPLLMKQPIRKPVSHIATHPPHLYPS